MELPANPNDLVKGVYSREGRLDDPKKNAEKEIRLQAIHALSPDINQDYEYRYGMAGYKL